MIHSYLILSTDDLVQLIRLNLEMFLLYHVAEMLKIRLGRIFFWKDSEKFAVSVTKMVYL